MLDASAGSVLIVASSNKTTRTKTFTLMLYEVKWLYSKSSAIIRHMKLVGMTTPVAAPDSAAGQQQTSSSSSSSTTGFFIFLKEMNIKAPPNDNKQHQTNDKV